MEGLQIAYISGPISGLENLNKEAFDRAEEILREQGHVVFNPFKICVGVHRFRFDTDEDYWKACMEKCLYHIPKSTAIIVLDGWVNSRGAVAEIYTAQIFGKKLFRITDGIVREMNYLDFSFLTNEHDE